MKKRLLNGVETERPGIKLQNRAHQPERLAGARFEVKNEAADEATMYIYGDIAWYDITAQDVAQALAGVTAKTINVRINSGGGDVFDGIAIYNLLAQSSATINVFIDGLAASIASVIAMAGDKITIAKNASMMIHNAWGVTIGDKNDMRAMADVLDMADEQIAQMYVDRSGGKSSASDIATMMNGETWMNAQACIDKGFADAIADPTGAKALIRSGLYANAPKELLATTDDWMCAAAHDLPIDEATSLDGPAAAERMLDDAGFNGSNPDPAKAKVGFLCYDAANPKQKSSYKEPFADIVGGTKKALKSGLDAAASRLPQTDVQQSVKDAARAVLDAYESRMKDDGNKNAAASRIANMRQRQRLMEVSI